MNRARTFFYAAGGVFLLALSYHLGATSATAQGPGTVAAAAGNLSMIVTTSGDVYTLPGSITPSERWVFHSNIFSGAPTPTDAQSFGRVKARYR